MRTQATRSIDTADVAKMVRKALKAEFPGQKFSVRSSRYAGGSSISVSWTDGPSHDAVQRVCDRYRGAHFDGMQDLTIYHSTMLSTEDGLEEVRMGGDYIHAQRTISAETYRRVGEEISAAAGEPCDLSQIALGGSKGAGWDSRYRLAVIDGQLCRDRNGMEYGSTLVHQLLRDRSL